MDDLTQAQTRGTNSRGPEVHLTAEGSHSRASKILAVIDRLGIAWSIALASCVLSVLSVSIASFTHHLSGDPIGLTGLFNTAVIPFLLGVPTLLVLFSLMRQLEKTRADLDRLSTLDVLTGAMNRRSLLAFGEAACVAGSADTAEVSVALIDADWFKQVNDAHGHLVGDETLCSLTRSVQAILPDDCLFGRYGGEEFGVILPGWTHQAALQQAEELRAAVEQSCAVVCGKMVGVTVSIGVASAGRRAMDLAELLSEADEALYAAKGAGRNRVMSAQSLAERSEQ